MEKEREFDLNDENSKEHAGKENEDEGGVNGVSEENRIEEDKAEIEDIFDEEEKSLKQIMEDFELMKAVYSYHQSKNEGRNSEALYSTGYSSVEKRALRRYAKKYKLEGKIPLFQCFYLI